MPRIESRSSQIDNERCVDAMGGRYDLVIMAAQRLRELKRANKDSGRYVTAIDALKDVESGLVNPADYIVKIR
jgi:DNA-directed RNA polymerase subunit K/omega